MSDGDGGDSDFDFDAANAADGLASGGSSSDGGGSEADQVRVG
jgi:hypothetical protein